MKVLITITPLQKLFGGFAIPFTCSILAAIKPGALLKTVCFCFTTILTAFFFTCYLAYFLYPSATYPPGI